MNNRIILEAVGIFSVIGSLLFVGVEIRQNTAAVRGATQQDISYQISEMYKIGVENNKIASIMTRSFHHQSRLSDLCFECFDSNEKFFV